MAQCKWCSRSGWFMSVSSEGLCDNCRPAILLEVRRRIQIINDSMKIVDTSKNLDTRLSRLELLLEHARAVAAYEAKGISISRPSASEIFNRYSGTADKMIIETLTTEFEAATTKSRTAATLSSKTTPFNKLIAKIREYKDKITNKQSLNALEKKVIDASSKIQLDAYLEEAKKAEFKSQKKKALDKYYEALYLLKHDDIDDTIQKDSISMVELKIIELGGTIK